MKRKKVVFFRPIFIYCEGETEQCYFDALKEVKRPEFKANKIIIKEVIKVGQLPTEKERLSKFIDGIFRSIQIKYQISFKELSKYGAKIIFLLDVDVYTKKQLEVICALLDQNKLIEVYFSNYDFEYFILSHIDPYYGASRDYIKIIQKKFPDYSKGYSIRKQEIHRELISTGYEIALSSYEENRKKYLGIGKQKHIKDMLPFTDIPLLFKNLL